MLTVLDIIHLIQYYYHNLNYEAAAADVETFRLELLRGVSSPDLVWWTPFDALPDIEKSLGVATPPMLKEHPGSTLYDAAKVLIQTHARRLPLLDYDTETGHEVIVSVLTQYRLLKFISINVFDPFHSLPSTSLTLLHQCTREIQQLHLSLRKLKIGTYVSKNIPPEASDACTPYWPIATATLDTPVFDVVHMFSERAISAVPIIDDDGVVVNLYETVDVIVCHRNTVEVTSDAYFKDTCSSWSISSTRLDDIRGTHPTVSRLSRCRHLYSWRLAWHATPAYQKASCP